MNPQQQNFMNVTRKFISKNDTPFSDNPYKYFKRPTDPVGLAKLNNKIYLLKMIPLSNQMALASIPEVQIMDSDFSSPYVPGFIDYVIEQHEAQGMTIDKAVFIVTEMIEEDLYSLVKKKGPLDLPTLLKLLECLVTGNYDLQKQLEIAHGDLKPSNIYVKSQSDAITGQESTAFYLSFFDNNNYMVINNSSFVDSLAYKAPELLLSTLVSTNYMNNSITYNPSGELKQILEKSGDEIKFNPFRSDTFSMGLVLLYASTGFQFVLRKANLREEIYREGPTEAEILNACITQVKKKYNCPPLTEILRLLLSQNPFTRYDFEELAYRMNKLSQMNKAIPSIEVEGHNVVPMEDHETLKENYWELQEMVEDLQQKVRDLESAMQSMKDDQRATKKPTSSSTGNPLTKNILNEISTIKKDQTLSFLSESMIKDYSIIKEKDESVLEEEERINNEMSNQFKKFDLKQNTLTVEFSGSSDEEILLQAETLQNFLQTTRIQLEGIELLGWFSDRGFECLKEGLSKVNTVKILIINLQGMITDAGLKNLSSSLIQIRTIEFFKIDILTVLNISEKGLDFLCQGIRIWVNLREFIVSLNPFNANYGKVDIAKEKASKLGQRLLNEHQNVRNVAISVNWKDQNGEFEGNTM